MPGEKVYIAIDLKSFYASVECVQRGLDPLRTNLVVADKTRTEKTICLAVSPSLKAHGIPGRARLFEVIRQVERINAQRRMNAPGHKFTSSSFFADELERNRSLELDYIVASPQMAKYMEISTQIFNIYLRYIAPEDIHVYSIDEVFIDATHYLETYKLTPRELTMKMIKDVLSETGITATAGIGTNLYLCKIAMDVEAKHITPDENGVRIAELDEMSYRLKLWSHTPLTDFWRIGGGYSKKLADIGLYTMGDIARYSLTNSARLYKLFGVNAELLIDHAWGREPVGMKDIKEYKTANNSISTGQVLKQPYDFTKGRLIIREMADLLSLDLVSKRIVTDQMVLSVGYDAVPEGYSGNVELNRYGKTVPKGAHGSINLERYTSSSRIIIKAVTDLYERIVDPSLFVRRMSVCANHVIYEKDVPCDDENVQLSFFTDFEQEQKKKQEEQDELDRERKRQEAILEIKRKFGKNAILKGMNLEEGATAIERNGQVGGHKA